MNAQIFSDAPASAFAVLASISGVPLVYAASKWDGNRGTNLDEARHKEVYSVPRSDVEHQMMAFDFLFLTQIGNRVFAKRVFIGLKTFHSILHSFLQHSQIA
jgi:hypothetical protein